MTRSRHHARVAVVGSLNVDYVVFVDRLPQPGETLPASKLLRFFGGKGANQAIAAARQGAHVSLIGCVGSDEQGHAYRRRLEVEGIDTTGLATASDILTGTALISVDRSGENTIVVAPGANGEMTPGALRAQARLIASADVVLLQFEIPLPALLAAVRLADKVGVPVVLNPSPMHAGFPWGRLPLHAVLVNAGEAHALFGLHPGRLTSMLPAWRRAMLQKKIRSLIITRSAEPTLCLTATDFLEVPTLPVRPVDTVGAGDAFAGAFASRFAEGMDLPHCIRVANVAAALATLKKGAQEGMPNRAHTNRAAHRLPQV